MKQPQRQGKPRQTRQGFTVDPRLPEAARGLASAVHARLGISAFHSRRLIRAGQVRVNGDVVRNPAARLALKDRVELGESHSERNAVSAVPAKARMVIAAKPAHPALLFHDEQIAVVFKPAGLLTVPTPKRERNTLVGWLARELGKGKRHRPEVRVVQRLDREVSGVLVFALTEPAWKNLREQFEQHQPERRYLAIVAGRVEPAQGTFSSLLATGRHLQRRPARSAQSGERAITHYQVLHQLGGAALVEVWLETGRRHQIRVHFAEAGNPILGENRYRRDLATHAVWPAERLALHAANLAFNHPATSKPIQFQSPMPWEFARFIKVLIDAKPSPPGKPVGTKPHRKIKPLRSTSPQRKQGRSLN